MERPVFQQRLAATGFEPIGGDLATTQAFVASEIAKWRDIVRTLGVEPA
jgi:tripartite-type tricarboxylate transporter receptor subunit TctC